MGSLVGSVIGAASGIPGGGFIGGQIGGFGQQLLEGIFGPDTTPSDAGFATFLDTGFPGFLDLELSGGGTHGGAGSGNIGDLLNFEGDLGGLLSFGDFGGFGGQGDFGEFGDFLHGNQQGEQQQRSTFSWP
jgi:hypothetical protein